MMEGDPASSVSMMQRKKKSKNSRRFSDEQIKSLETFFKLEAKLEPRKKLQMARDLGLQPRQVVIWFQNKRARWKSKQIEQEYRSLKADYDELNSRFESLKKEKHSLVIQLEKLRDQLNTPGEGSRESKDVVGNSTDSCSENGDRVKFQLKANSSSLSGGVDHDMRMYSDDEEIRRMNDYVGERDQGDEFHSLSTDQQVDGFSEPTERLSGFVLDDDGLFDDQPWCHANLVGLLELEILLSRFSSFEGRR